jgi:hypothetical protein
MVNGNGRIPKREAAKLIADYKLSQIVIVARTQCGTQICVTDGLTIRDQENAAAAGKIWDKIMSLGKRNCPSLSQLLREISGKD